MSESADEGLRKIFNMPGTLSRAARSDKDRARSLPAALLFPQKPWPYPGAAAGIYS